MTTPTLNQFLEGIAKLLKARDGLELRSYLVLEPPFAPIYQKVIEELRRSFPVPNADRRNKASTPRLEQKVEKALPERDVDENRSGTFTSFNIFLAEYLLFIRDVEQSDVSVIFQNLQKLLQKLSAALGDNQMGVVILPTATFFCDTFAKFTFRLEKSPELTAPMVAAENARRTEPVNLGGMAQESIRKIFDKCQPMSRRYGIDAQGRPKDRAVGLYSIANICFRLCLRTGSLQPLESIMSAIDAKSPALASYPASQRVTYLYYLGRYWFVCSHFGRANKAYHAAYAQTPPQFLSQRAQILTHLLVTNMILGRLPSKALLQRPEAAALAPHLGRISQAIREGNLALFHSLLDLESSDASAAATAHFLWKRKALLQVRGACEILVWRSLLRRIFILDGFHGSAEVRSAPNFDLTIARAVVVQLYKRSIPENPNSPFAISKGYIDPDFEGADADYPDLLAGDDDEGVDCDDPSLGEVEATAASLVEQGLIHGYISHRLAKVVITGSKGKNPVEVGFPQVSTILGRDQGGEVFGWVTKERLARELGR